MDYVFCTGDGDIDVDMVTSMPDEDLATSSPLFSEKGLLEMLPHAVKYAALSFYLREPRHATPTTIPLLASVSFSCLYAYLCPGLYIR